MSFFNKKEEVIHFKLTPYGRYLLSLGKMKPKYYAFFDDNVLYAPEFAEVEEKQNDTETRVQDNTPYFRAQHAYSSVEKNLNSLKKNCRTGFDEIVREQHDSDKLYSLSAPIGNADISTDTAPAWQVQLLRSELTRFDAYMTGSFPTSKIPQLHFDIPFNIKTLDREQAENYKPKNNMSYLSSVFEDGSAIAIEGDMLLADVLENNTDFLKDNFEIEVFQVEKQDTTGSVYTPGVPDSRRRERLVPLTFIKKPETIVDGFLLDDEEVEKIDRLFKLDDTYVEYFFDINVDTQISAIEVCKSLDRLERRQIYLDIGYNCQDFDSGYNPSNSTYSTTYATDITEDDSEQC
jgi:hypothetical protein